MIKDNSGYRASPRRIETLAGHSSDVKKSTIAEKSPKKGNNTPKVQEKVTPQSTPRMVSKPKLTKSTIKNKPTKSFYGAKAAKTPKGAKRKTSVSKDDIPAPKKTRVSSPLKSKTPQKNVSNANMLKLTKSTVKNKKTNNFYGRNAAKTPKGAKSMSKAVSQTLQLNKKRLSTPRGNYGIPFVLEPTKNIQIRHTLFCF